MDVVQQQEQIYILQCVEYNDQNKSLKIISKCNIDVTNIQNVEVKLFSNENDSSSAITFSFEINDLNSKTNIDLHLNATNDDSKIFYLKSAVSSDVIMECIKSCLNCKTIYCNLSFNSKNQIYQSNKVLMTNSPISKADDTIIGLQISVDEKKSWKLVSTLEEFIFSNGQIVYLKFIVTRGHAEMLKDYMFIHFDGNPRSHYLGKANEIVCLPIIFKDGKCRSISIFHPPTKRHRQVLRYVVLNPLKDFPFKFQPSVSKKRKI
jgi:hypothetical protein